MDSTLLFVLLIVFMVGMLFMTSRQRKKQQQQHEQLQNSINVGDVVVMTSGISGTVVDTEDEKTIDLEIAPDVITTWLRAAVREKLSPDATYDPHAEQVEGGLGDHAGHEAVTPAPGSHTGPAESQTTGMPITGASTTAPTTESTPGAGRNGAEPSDEVSSPRSS